VSLSGSALPCSGARGAVDLPAGRHTEPPKPAARVSATADVAHREPFARAGFDVFFTNRWPGMSIDIAWPEVAAVHATALAEYFGQPVHVLGHSTGGSIVMQLIADHPEVVRRAVAASAAYALGPVARRAQFNMLRSLETTGRFAAEELLDGMVHRRWLSAALRPPLRLVSRRINVENPTDTMAMIKAEDGFDVAAACQESKPRHW
jgi:pimeloyl-ACP methyl ester carboxylesterase